MTLKAVLDNLDDITSEDVKAEYKEKNGKFYLELDGAKPIDEFNTVHTALTNERKAHKATKESLGAFGPLKPDEVRAQLDRIPALELAADGKLDDAKIDQLVDKKIHAKLAPVERERDTLKTQVLEKDKVIDQFTVQERTRKITDSVVKAAKKAKVLEPAQEDAIILAERIFEVQDDNSVVTRDGVGVTPGLTPDAWLADLQEKRPHWWAPSQGGGGRQGGGGNREPNPFSYEAWNMTAQGQLYKTDPQKATRLAAAAGTTIGGPKPDKK